MIQWLREWWRFLAAATVTSVINLLSEYFIGGPISTGLTTFVNFIMGGNMIFDLINRPAWQRRVQERDEQIAERDEQIAERDRHLDERDRVIEDKDREIESNKRALEDKDRALEDKDRTLEDKDREIAELRRQVEEGKNGNSVG